MRSLNVRAVLLLLAISCFARGIGSRGRCGNLSQQQQFLLQRSTVATSSATMERQTGFFYTAGDFVTEIFFTGQTSITGLSYDFFLLDNLGGNPGAPI